MIVRIFTEGQYRVPAETEERLAELDSEVIAAIEAGDEQRFRDSYTRLVELVRSDGEPLADDDLSQSDLLLPPADATLEEVRAEFTDEGLIPD